MIKNEAVLNEELDPKLMIERLRREIQQLKDELSLATGEQRTDSLTDDEIFTCVLLASFVLMTGTIATLVCNIAIVFALSGTHCQVNLEILTVLMALNDS